MHGKKLVHLVGLLPCRVGVHVATDSCYPLHLIWPLNLLTCFKQTWWSTRARSAKACRCSGNVWKTEMWDPSCAHVRQWEQNIQYKSFDAGKKILWDLTPSQTPESGSYRSPMSPNYRKPSILLSSAQETTWGCSCKCCDWLCVLHHGSWRRCSSQSGHGWHSAAWLSHLGKQHISLCSWFQPFPPACLQQVLKVTLQWQLHSALLNNLPENPNQMELKQGNTFLHLQTCLSAAETQQRVCYRCFAGCSRLRSGRRGPAAGLLFRCWEQLVVFSVAAPGWERTGHHASSVCAVSCPLLSLTIWVP